jgi:flagellar biosynthesis/type III secretory pathway chaperone
MTNTDQAYRDLYSLLDQEAGIYEQLAALLEAEREALVHLAASELGEICSRKETLALRIKALDESRRVLSERLGRRFGLAGEELTVTALLRFAPDALGDRLDAVRRRLQEQVERCKNINEYNARAAGRGLELIGGAIRHLIGDSDPANRIYRKKGGCAAYGARPNPAMVSQKV